MLSHGFAGAVVGWGVLTGLVATDTAGLGSLLVHADLGGLAMMVLALQFGGGIRDIRDRHGHRLAHSTH